MIPRSNSANSFWLTCSLVLLTTSTVASLAYMAATAQTTTTDKKEDERRRVSIAFLGNSIQYFNDCPRLVQSMLKAAGMAVRQNSCLRGGSNLESLWMKGNGMRNKFATPPAVRPNGGGGGGGGSFDIGAPTPKALLHPQTNNTRRTWDYVLFQDHTQHPTRHASRTQSMEALKKHYLPLLQEFQSQTTVLLLQTYAYRVKGLKETEDLGDFHAFTERLVEGYQMYSEVFQEAGFPVQIVPMGRAVQFLYKHRRHDLWEKLYSWDDFHPSPHGTWLQACLIFLVTTRGTVAPPTYDPLWWDDCRYMQPPEQKPLPLPTVQEAEELRQVAMLVYHNEIGKFKARASSPTPAITTTTTTTTECGKEEGDDLPDMIPPAF